MSDDLSSIPSYDAQGDRPFVDTLDKEQMIFGDREDSHIIIQQQQSHEESYVSSKLDSSLDSDMIVALQHEMVQPPQLRMDILAQDNAMMQQDMSPGKVPQLNFGQAKE